ncbi:MAG: 3-deoxy-manno-octulosonate cytidylyltransferase [bacterium]|nr:3-deoxy-manno-octulosonate cytidylyltransferase [bacterium]
MTAIAVIPARYASTRFPGKPLARKTGRYLIQHVHDRVCRARSVDRAVVATDDERIAAAVRTFGGEVAMTDPDHASGTDRVAEVAAGLSCEVIINVQGDEPEIEPAAIDRVVGLLDQHGDCPVATLACPFSKVPQSDPADPAAVKVVTDSGGRALYFTRSQVPYNRTEGGGVAAAEPLLHVGIYAYRREFLIELAAMAPTPLERTERLEQLRVLENGHRIAVGLIDRACVGIDTPDDYEAFVSRMAAGQSDPESQDVSHAK